MRKHYVFPRADVLFRGLEVSLSSDVYKKFLSTVFLYCGPSVDALVTYREIKRNYTVLARE
jgi:hypothetical protein